jgi:hypothetical protein
MRIKYFVDYPDDLSAGIRGFTDTIVIDVESGDPGGKSGEFTDFMRDSLTEWYDGAKVTIIN